ncbi:hypothetical protein [Zooshikella ganghwensis]|uniref:Uncharacterized protein n=2 Tax=Zooshikella ganghwensis TaxID=202772 RepID=A0A4P9VQY5_9GAMM|nr:hypothetical protein [Zooshikella ganghwensis]RDH45199.1 hypothetical protein B9G39_18100 [Zooshikella ganghwensis]
MQQQWQDVTSALPPPSSRVDLVVDPAFSCSIVRGYFKKDNEFYVFDGLKITHYVRKWRLIDEDLQLQQIAS